MCICINTSICTYYIYRSFFAGAPASLVTMAENSILTTLDHDSIQQNLSILLTDFLKSHAKTLADNIVGLKQEAIMGPILEVAASQDLCTPAPEVSRAEENVMLQAIGEKGISLPNSNTNISTQNLIAEQARPSYRNILAPPNTLSDSCDMVAKRKGEYLSVKVDDALVKYGVSELVPSLIGKLSLVQGDSPYSLDALYSKLSQIWGITGDWQLVPLGKGYYNIQLPSLADRDRVLDRRSWSLKPGLFRLQRWVRGFNPYKVNTTLAQVWVRIYEIPMEYFQPKIIHALASALGTVIKIDDRTWNRTMCHYARVLIEIDMTKGCEDYIIFESEGQVLFASLKYEQLPPFCNHCGIVGHSLDSCKSVKGRKVVEDKSMAGKNLGRQMNNTRKDVEWVPKEST